MATAATHATELLRRYGGDKDTRAIAETILSKVGGQLAQLEISCRGGCMLLVDKKAVAAKPRDQYTIFTQPGRGRSWASLPVA